MSFDDDVVQVTCPKKQYERTAIIAALELKKLGGSIVLERVNCGKRGCHCQSGIGHGPYNYLHFWSQGKVKRRYLCKAVAELMCYSREELESLLSEVESARERVLGQASSGVI